MNRHSRTTRTTRRGNKSARQLKLVASANLLKLMGRDLITNEYVAVAELIKNAYDAEATRATVKLSTADANESRHMIIIEDDGTGADLGEFKANWLRPGFSWKQAPQPIGARRVPVGEKGIGRFAADKLGSRLDVFTRKAGSERVLAVHFNWDLFRDESGRTDLDEVPIGYEYVAPESVGFVSPHGTRLVITALRRANWTEAATHKLQREIEGLLTPWTPVSDFRVELVVDKYPLPTPVALPKIDRLCDYAYWFSVDTSGSVTRQVVRPAQEGWAGATKAQELEGAKIRAPFGPIVGRFYYFASRTRLHSLKLQMPPGIRVYRDRFRVLPFGDEGEDWLGIKRKRASRAGHVIPTAQMYGYVEIARRDNPLLLDTTAREALTSGPEYEAFVQLIRGEYERFSALLERDEREPRRIESKRKREQQDVEAKLQALSDLAPSLAHEIRQPLQTIQSSNDTIKVLLEKMAVSDEELVRCCSLIDDNVSRIDKTIEFIRQFARGDLEAKDSFDVTDTVRHAVAFFEQQTKPRGIELKLITDAMETVVVTNKLAVTIALTNLLKNAISAVQKVDRPGKRILVRLTEPRDNSFVITVSDNGIGIAPEAQKKLFKRFHTTTTGGWGYGLYHSKLIMQRFEGGMRFVPTNDGLTTFQIEFGGLQKTQPEAKRT